MDAVDLFLIQLAAVAGAGWVSGQLLIELLVVAVSWASGRFLGKLAVSFLGPHHRRLVAAAAATSRAFGRLLAERIDRRPG